MVLHLNKLESPSPKDALCQVWLKLAQWFWRRRSLNFSNVFSPFRNYLTLGKERGPSFEQIWIRFTQGCFVPSFVEIGSVVLEKKVFKFHQCISLFCNYLPLKRGRALHLNKLEFPSPKNAFWQVWLKLAQWFSRRRFLKVVNLFLLFPNYLPFGKGVAVHLNKLESPSPRDTLCQVWLKSAQWFWRRKWKCEKFTDRQTDRRTDRRRTTGDQKSSGELKTYKDD